MRKYQAVVALLSLCFGLVVGPIAYATTKVSAVIPYRASTGSHFEVIGSNQRNNTCNALACEDRTHLERSSWTGWRKVDSSEKAYSQWTAWACMDGTYDWKTVHRARYLTDKGTSFGISVGGVGVNVGTNGPGWSGWFSSSSTTLSRANTGPC